MPSREDFTSHQDYVAAMSADAYVEHVVRLLRAGQRINHPVQDWHAEMSDHLKENFGACRQVAGLAIGVCRNRLRSEESRTDG